MFWMLKGEKPFGRLGSAKANIPLPLTFAKLELNDVDLAADEIGGIEEIITAAAGERQALVDGGGA